MYGYSVSGAESEGSSFANLTGQPVPEGFSLTIIPSLLFGSLISATDPGELKSPPPPRPVCQNTLTLCVGMVLLALVGGVKFHPGSIGPIYPLFWDFSLPDWTIIAIQIDVAVIAP